MTLQKQLTLSALVALTLQTTFGMINQTSLIIVPGLNGAGGEDIEIVFPQFPKESIQRAQTPDLGRTDFGQGQCINLLEQTMKTPQDDPNIKNIIIHASSQGTATILNYMANNSNKIKAVILETPSLSGNSTIMYNSFPNSSSSLLHYVVPYLFKIHCPFYSPAGQQPVFTCNNLPEDLPIIIIHGTQHPELSPVDPDDAQALYAYIKNKGNKNVYFLPIANADYECHVNILKPICRELAVINAILKKEELPFVESTQKDVSKVFEETDSINLEEYQPNPKEKWLRHFNTLKNRETKIYYLDWCLKGALAGFIFYILHKTGAIDSINNKLPSLI